MIFSKIVSNELFMFHVTTVAYHHKPNLQTVFVKLLLDDTLNMFFGNLHYPALFSFKNVAGDWES